MYKAGAGALLLLSANVGDTPWILLLWVALGDITQSVLFSPSRHYPADLPLHPNSGYQFLTAPFQQSSHLRGPEPGAVAGAADLDDVRAAAETVLVRVVPLQQNHLPSVVSLQQLKVLSTVSVEEDGLGVYIATHQKVLSPFANQEGSNVVLKSTALLCPIPLRPFAILELL